MKKIVCAVLLCVASSPLLAAESNIPSHKPASTLHAVKKININTADVAILMHSMKGIGAKRAEAIIQYRTQHGLFKTIDELASVRGFGSSFVKSHAEQLHAIFFVDSNTRK